MFGSEQIANAGVDAAMTAGTHPDKAEASNGFFKLRMPRIYWILGCLGLALCLPYAVVPFFERGGSTFWLPLGVGMLIVLGVPGFMCLMYGLNHIVLIGNDKFYVKGPLKPMRAISWKEVQSGRYSSLEKAMVLTLIDGRKVRVSAYLKGAKLFWRLLHERSGRPVGDWGLPYAYWK